MATFDEMPKCECVGTEHFDELCTPCQNVVKDAADGSPVSDFLPLDERNPDCNCDECLEDNYQYHKQENF